MILDEVFICYRALCRGEQARFLHRRPYHDYIAWLQQQDRSQAEIFWRQELQDFSTPTSLNIDRAAGTSMGQKIEIYEQQVRLPIATCTALQHLVRQHQLTLNTLMQGVWALLLSHYSGYKDVIFGATVSNRPASMSGVESMIGLFINTLPVRVRVQPMSKLLPWLQNLQSRQAEARQYEYSSLMHIQRWSDISPNQSLFESLLVFENYPTAVSAQKYTSSLRIDLVEVFEQSNYPLALLIGVEAQELVLAARYNRNRFETAMIARMLGHWQTLLNSIVTNPDQYLSNLSYLTKEECQQLLIDWNITNVDNFETCCVHQLFERQVVRTPNAIAVVFENASITYHELNQRANQMAHSLQAHSVGPEVLVGICIERSIEMMVGILGILKAGGAYVPLDPTYPQERLSFILQDTRLAVLLTQERLLQKLPLHEAHTICLDSSWRVFSQHSRTNPGYVTEGTNLAYVIYTSGSTGRPKGTMITHQGVVNYLNWCAQAYAVEQGQGSPVHTPLSFDLTITSLLSPLVVGSTVFLLPEEAGIDGLCTAIRNNYHFSLIKITPAHLELLSREISTQEIVGRTKAFIIGGEALQKESFASWQNAAPDIIFVNEYGPTEAVVGCCTYQVPIDGRQSGRVPIGRPIANTQLYILDAHLQPVPVGIPGELYIGGHGLARGYLNQAELTSERFIPHPFSNELGARLYKTGDIVRYLIDGNIEFLGRIDNQIKIRGCRVELGEIETLLEYHPDVKEAAVIVSNDTSHEKQIIAYIVQQKYANLHASNIRQYLKKRLPDYMMPSTYIFLDALPLSRNGKVDRQSLPLPNGPLSETQGVYIAPHTPVEKVIASIWSEVLKREQISIHDNFFDLGGHSLLAIQIISRLYQTFRMRITTAQLFSCPTIAELTKYILREPHQRANMEKIAQVSLRLMKLTDEEVEAMLSVKKPCRGDNIV